MAQWHNDPDLKERFHPQYPDDLQVLIHEGSFRFTDKKPEVAWVHILNRLQWMHEGFDDSYAYRGILLNKPHQTREASGGPPRIPTLEKASWPFVP